MTECIDTRRGAAIEHAMRLGAGEAAVLALAQSEPASPRALATLGRVMDTPGALITSGSPLYAWCAGGEISDDWRERCPADRGLWAELTDLRSMFGDTAAVIAGDVYEELQALRERADLSIVPD
jgi:hypothetical protein